MKTNFEESPALVSVEEVLEQMNIGTLLQRKACDPEELRYKLEKASALVSILTSLSSKSNRNLLIESNSAINVEGRKALLSFFDSFEKRAVVFLPNPTVIQQRSVIASYLLSSNDECFQKRILSNPELFSHGHYSNVGLGALSTCSFVNSFIT